MYIERERERCMHMCYAGVCEDDRTKSEQRPDHRNRSLKAFEEHAQTAVSYRIPFV